MTALGLRPLLFGLAWKVLDVEVESALAATLLSPPNESSGWQHQDLKPRGQESRDRVR